VLVDCAFGEVAIAEIAEAARAAGVGRLFILFSPTERRALNSETLRRFHGWLVKPVRSASLLARFAPHSQRAGAEAPRARDAAPKLEGVQVLLAEDNEISRRVALKHLERHGARVTCAGDGDEACRLANESAHDVIILNIRMPVLDGLAAAGRIRSTEGAGRRTPLICADRKRLRRRQTGRDRGRHRLFYRQTGRPLRLGCADRDCAGTDAQRRVAAARVLKGNNVCHIPFSSNSYDHLR
jgi:CheY-like chemotaxis protein